jgi:hypothetical protein
MLVGPFKQRGVGGVWEAVTPIRISNNKIGLKFSYNFKHGKSKAIVQSVSHMTYQKIASFSKQNFVIFSLTVLARLKPSTLG